MSKRSVAARSLWPREHGAYIQLLLPLVTALIATQPGLAAISLASGAGLAFLASEPLRVLLGDRGPRMQELARRRARWRLVALGTSALIAGSLGLALGPRSSLWTSLLVAPPIGFLVNAARRRTLDTLGGELVAAVALCGAAAPVAVAGGMAIGDALVMWCAWSLAYVTTVIAAHHVIACHRGAKPLGYARRWGALVGVALGTLIAFDSTAWFAAPLVGVALAVIALTPAATRLRTIGFTFLAGSAVSAVCAIASVELRDRGCALERAPHGARACRGSRTALLGSSLGMLAAPDGAWRRRSCYPEAMKLPVRQRRGAPMSWGPVALVCGVLATACGRIGFTPPKPDALTDVEADASLDGTSGDPPAMISWLQPFVQRHRGSGTSDSFTAQAGAGHAVVMQVACATGGTPSSVAVSAPGWNFRPIDPLFNSPTQGVWAATFGAMSPSASSVTVSVVWAVSDCVGGIAELGDEFANAEPAGGAMTFDAHVQTLGTGNCTATVTTGYPNEAVWGACLAVAVTGVGSGYTLGANDSAGDLSEYKLTTDPAGTLEVVTFANPAAFVMSVVTIKPR